MYKARYSCHLPIDGDDFSLTVSPTKSPTLTPIPAPTASLSFSECLAVAECTGIGRERVVSCEDGVVKCVTSDTYVDGTCGCCSGTKSPCVVSNNDKDPPVKCCGLTVNQSAPPFL